MAVAIKGESTASMPSVGNIPQHEVAVQLLKGIACIKQRDPKAGVGDIAGVVLFIGDVLVDPGVICSNGSILIIP